VWTADKLIATSAVHPFRSNVIDFDSQPRCWAGSAFDYVHYSVPRKGPDDIAEDLGFGRVSNYRLAVLEDDLVVAQITKSILPFLGRSDSDDTLSHITNTRPRELGGQFWLQLITCGIGPLLGLLTTLFPSVTDFVASGYSLACKRLSD
jgi:hypothetical protein